MKNEFYFQVNITAEQVKYANELVDFSIKNHPVTDIFSTDPNGKERQREFRFTGSLGEIVFADTYRLPRPVRSFGAIDGQDFGQDFVLSFQNKQYSFDIKTMQRKNNIFRENYVLNLPSYQVHKDISKTDYYFCISIHYQNPSTPIASFIGYISKQDIIDRRVGDLFVAGTKRIKDNGGSFVFQRDTYEVLFKDIHTPFLADFIRKIQGFKELYILPSISSKTIDIR